MRAVLTELARELPEHMGLAYDAFAPTKKEGKVPDDERLEWLQRLERMEINPDYAKAFERWESSFTEPGARCFRGELVSRLLIGHGCTSATDVGLTVHHTWGVPVIPGSALKGLLSHYIQAHYGPKDPYCTPWEQEEQDRWPWQGVTWKNGRIVRGPGPHFRKLFGAPDAETDKEMIARGFEAGATAGAVVFHDALFVPGSVEHPFATDVLTVHQKNYYDKSGTSAWPNDYDSPNPVSFLTVRPGAHMFFALTGDAEWTELVEELLKDALSEWGIGGKTSSGYGRFARDLNVVVKERLQQTAPKAKYQRGNRIKVTRVEDPKKRKFQADDGLFAYFAQEDAPDTPVGNSVDVWVGNVAGSSYTITLRDPSQKKGGKSGKK